VSEKGRRGKTDGSWLGIGDLAGQVAVDMGRATMRISGKEMEGSVPRANSDPSAIPGAVNMMDDA